MERMRNKRSVGQTIFMVEQFFFFEGAILETYIAE
jgi:hypothetical protein